MKRVLAGALLLLGLAGPAEATQARTEVTPRRAHVGDVITLKIHVDRREGDRVTLPRSTSFRPFEVVKRRTKTEVKGRNVRETLEVDLMAFELGNHVIPSVELRVVDREGRISAVRTDPATVNIASLLGNEPDAKRKGNHGPASVFEKDYLWLWVALGVVVFGLQFLLLRAFMKRKAAFAAVPVVIEKRPPWEIAMEKLRGIDRSKLVEKGLVKEHYDGVSDAIREYLGALGGFEGLESTTDEVLAGLRATAPRGVDMLTVEHFFGECDLVKFAKYSPGVDEPKAIFSMGVRIVETSRAVHERVLAAQAAPPPPAPPAPTSPPSGEVRA